MTFHLERLDSSTAPLQPAEEVSPQKIRHLNEQKLPTALEVSSLSLFYADHLALNQVNLPIYQGKITALLGPSGCGKTSFLNVLNRMTDLINHCRVEGQVLFQGRNIYERDADIRILRQRIGMIFQKPNPFPFSIRRNFHIPLKEHGYHDKDERDTIMQSVLSAVGLWHEVKYRLDHPALRLSGGQQQRLCFARALALKPEVLLMDEPCSALDPLASAAIEELVKELAGDYTIVIVTHNLQQARRIADFGGLFWSRNNTGTLVEFSPAERLFHQPRHELTRAYVSGLSG